MTHTFKTNTQKINILDDNIHIEVTTAEDKEYLYAAYLLDSRSVCIEKIKYQKENFFKFNKLPIGKYRIRLFTKDKKTEQKTAWGTSVIEIAFKDKNQDAEKKLNKILLNDFSNENLIEFIKKYPAHLSRLFQIIRSKTHNGKTKNKSGSKFADACLSLINFDWLTPAQHIFLINSILYTAPNQTIINNRSEIEQSVKTKKGIPESDRNFLSGLLEYRAGNYMNAQNEFQKLIKAKHNLLFHQTGALSYFYHLDDAQFNDITYHRELDFLQKTENKIGPIILMSCDYGYFVAYFKKTYEKLLKIGAKLHIHIIAPAEINMSEILRIIKGTSVGVSIELETKEQREKENRKTYYATARYLILQKIIQTYKENVLVADIDIDFNKPLEQGFFEMADNEIALYTSDSFLPWTKILAGFNLFGRNTSESEFLTKLKSFLSFCLNSDRDGWMLDQTALEVVYQSCSIHQKSKIKPITDIVEYLPKQYENRGAHRSTALTAMQGIVSQG
ncbi:MULTISPECIES: hypothetical protein [Alcaligenes]|uniref:hypothetical protein n=1 Tax=Alcaligenes TaxID=507 RepID=UPI00122C83C6|nr:MULTISPECIES: hypothetical protein [Alcaligenes]KAA1286178.1 hypothetical protein D7S43_11415 [Alcaligenes faecalis]MDT0217840.1 hypothetical protein [Alcaligenes sp. AB3]